MIKRFAIAVCFILVAGTFTLAQEQVDTTMQQQESQAWNAVCPVDGEPVSAEVPTIKYNGKDYGFDSPSCAVIFNDDASTYAANLSEDGSEFSDRAAGKPEAETETETEEKPEAETEEKPEVEPEAEVEPEPEPETE
jgi:YHS domain-containing protein